MNVEMIWVWGMLLVALYCAVQAARDFRRRAWIMGTLGVAAAVLLLSMPVQTHAVKVVLPQAAPQH